MIRFPKLFCFMIRFPKLYCFVICFFQAVLLRDTFFASCTASSYVFRKLFCFMIRCLTAAESVNINYKPQTKQESIRQAHCSRTIHFHGYDSRPDRRADDAFRPSWAAPSIEAAILPPAVGRGNPLSTIPVASGSNRPGRRPREPAGFGASEESVRIPSSHADFMETEVFICCKNTEKASY